MIIAGYLDQPDNLRLAAITLDAVLETTNESPLTQLARQVVAGVSHVGRTLFRWARRNEEDEVVEETRSRMAHTWDSFADYFQALAAQYDATYRQLAAQTAGTDER